MKGQLDPLFSIPLLRVVDSLGKLVVEFGINGLDVLNEILVMVGLSGPFEVVRQLLKEDLGTRNELGGAVVRAQ